MKLRRKRSRRAILRDLALVDEAFQGRDAASFEELRWQFVASRREPLPWTEAWRRLQEDLWRDGHWGT